MEYETSKICDALGNETRFALVQAMRNGAVRTCCDRIELDENGVSVADVVSLTGLAQSTVSRHLSVLEDAGIIYKEKRDSWSCYFLNEKKIRDFLRALEKDLLPGKSGCCS